MIPRRAAFVLILIAAIAAGQAASRPSWGTTRVPAGFSPTKIAARMAGMVQGEIVDRRLSTDGPGGFIQLKVWGTWIGSARRGEELSLHVDPKDPPCWIEIDRRDGFNIVFDANARLLLVSNLFEDRLPAVIATSRFPGRRYTQEELDYVAASAQDGADLFDMRDVIVSIDSPMTSVGALELLFRFGPGWRKRDLLQRLGVRALTKAEAESLRVCLWDVDTVVQAAAAHRILDTGGDVEKERLRSSIELMDPRASNPVFGPLLRLGDWQARSRVEFLLQAQHDHLTLHKRPLLGDENLQLLFEQAAWGPKEFVPLVERFLPGIPGVINPGTGLYAYLKLGASVSSPGRAAIEAQGAEAWAAILAADLPREPDTLAACAKEKLQAHAEAYLRAISQAFRNEASARSFIAGVGPPSEKVKGFRALLLAAACGHAGSFEELQKREWTEGDLSAVSWCSGEALARLRDPRVVDFLVAGLVAARRCGFEDCTGVCLRAVPSIAKLLGDRSASDRKRALDLLDGIPRVPEDARGQLTLIRAALGEPPAPEALLTLASQWFTENCGLTFAPWAERYAAALPAMRADPRKHSFALALLRDESVIDDLGRWLEEAVADPTHIGLSDALRALRLIGGKRALDELYAAAPAALKSGYSGVQATLLNAIVEVESPDHWKRVAGLVESSPGARAAAVRVLAKKP